jgi:hypothetical protein
MSRGSAIWAKSVEDAKARNAAMIAASVVLDPTTTYEEFADMYRAGKFKSGDTVIIDTTSDAGNKLFSHILGYGIAGDIGGKSATGIPGTLKMVIELE